MQYDVIRHAGHRADMLHDVVDMQYAEVFTCIRSSIERKASRLSRLLTYLRTYPLAYLLAY